MTQFRSLIETKTTVQVQYFNEFFYVKFQQKNKQTKLAIYQQFWMKKMNSPIEMHLHYVLYSKAKAIVCLLFFFLKMAFLCVLLFRIKFISQFPAHQNKNSLWTGKKILCIYNMHAYMMKHISNVNCFSAPNNTNEQFFVCELRNQLYIQWMCACGNKHGNQYER